MFAEKISNESKKEKIEKEAIRQLRELGLDFEYLKGKTILDVGAGPAFIAEAAKNKGIKVISIDIDPEKWKKLEGELPDVPYIKASAEKLPFKDETFDIVISHAGPFNNTDSKDLIFDYINEAKRVLKNGGELRFGPGDLNANIFAEEELFNEAERKTFSREQRIDRIAQKSLELLKNIDPNIERIELKNSNLTSPLKSFYILKKENRRKDKEN
jgi:ubiquinone/menaquinone biosynthesis C-methylase UbiE